MQVATAWLLLPLLSIGYVRYREALRNFITGHASAGELFSTDLRQVRRRTHD